MYCHLYPPARGAQNIRHPKSQYATTRLHARAHTLWCAVKHDNLIHHNIICLTRDWSRFMSWSWPSTLWPSTLAVSQLSRDQTMYQILENRKIRGGIHRNNSSGGDWLGPTNGAYSPLLDPLDEFKLFMSSALAPGPAPKTLGHNRLSRHPKI